MEILARLAEVGGPTKGLSKYNKPELMQMLWSYDPDVLIWDDLIAKHRCQHRRDDDRARSRTVPRL
jgi:hypothetical protein